MHRLRRGHHLVAPLLALVFACASDPGAAAPCAGAKCDDGDQRAETRLCAGIRGNGQLITAHFASLARITEHYGLIDAAAGGSSASITIFKTESVRKNPRIWQCGEETCTEVERSARAALLLKSFAGYVSHLASTDEAAAFMQLAPLVAKISAAGIEELAADDAAAAAAALESLLDSEDIRDLVNPEVIALLPTTTSSSSGPVCSASPRSARSSAAPPASTPATDLPTTSRWKPS